MISDDRLSNSDDQIQMTDFLIKFRLHPKIKKESQWFFHISKIGSAYVIFFKTIVLVGILFCGIICMPHIIKHLKPLAKLLLKMKNLN